MKKIVLISAIVFSGLYYNTANAQIRVHLGLNFSPRPVYVPERVVVQQPVEYTEPANYDGDEDYYYLPDVDAYYSVTEQCYYYNDGDQWVSAAYLPGAYRDYDWRASRRFEVRAPRPFMHNDYYRTRFGGTAFNGRWDRDNNREYARDNHFNGNEYGRNDQHFDNNRGYGHQYQPARGQQNFGHNEQWGQRDNQNSGQQNFGHSGQWGQRDSQNHGQQNFGRNDQGNQRDNQNRGYDMGRGQQHFAQNNGQRNDRSERGDHRPSR